MIFSELRVFLSASHRKGIGRRLFELVKADNSTGTITVNSSPYAVEVYKHLGFTPTAPEKVEDGIRFTSMEFTASVIPVQ